MKIAQVSPLIESVPPRFYGGTERIVSYLTEELVRQGHDVTLFASGDSITDARLIPCCPKALRLDDGVKDYLPHTALLLEQVRRQVRDFDIVHFHIDYLHLPLFSTLGKPFVTTMHGRMDLPDIHPIFGAFPDTPLVSISDNQRLPMKANWAKTVYHGLPLDLYKPGKPDGEPYLAFLGRIAREKRVDRAIEIAKRAGMTLKIAAKVDPADQEFFDDEVKHLLDQPGIEFIGEIGEDEKQSFLANATALLFPIDWPEPFGLVMIESMACGTPVIAWKCGSVPEVLEDGVSGYVVEDMDAAVAAVPKVEALDRTKVRQRFEERFSSRRMAQDYVRVYEELTQGGRPRIRVA